MDRKFWLDKWEKNEIGFHMPEVHPLLRQFVSSLEPEGKSIFIPLCGKSLDIAFLAEVAAKVIGVELSGQAIEDYFRQQSKEPVKLMKAEQTVFQSGNTLLYQGDLFSFPGNDTFDVVYDRAALIALPEEMRGSYVKKIASLCHKGSRLLLISLVHDGAGGPPFSVPGDIVMELYEPYFSIEKLGEFAADVKGQEATEIVWYGEAF